MSSRHKIRPVSLTWPRGKACCNKGMRNRQFHAESLAIIPHSSTGNCDRSNCDRFNMNLQARFPFTHVKIKVLHFQIYMHYSSLPIVFLVVKAILTDESLKV
jgi:hypothetical protein